MLTLHKDSHLDHGLSERAIGYILGRFAERTGFFIETFEMPDTPANDRGGGAMPSINMPITIDATGADPAELSRVRGELERLRAEFPYLVVQAYYDATSRNVIR